jgi:hypothetical protein
MADVITGNTQLGPTKQDVIAAIVQKELKFAAKLLPYITDFSVFAGPGMKSVSFPKLSSFTVIDRASATAGDASALTSAVDQLPLDINAYVAWIIDSSDSVQSAIDAQIAFAQRSAAAHGRYVDENIILKAETVGVPTTTAGDITRNIVLEMRKALAKNDGDLAQASLWISPDQEEAMLKISEFSAADVYGQPVIPNGVIGRVYGVPVVVHNGLGTQQYFMLDKAGLAIAFQKAPAMSQQPANEYGTSAVRVAMDQLFGLTGLQLGEKGVLSTRSPLVIKDNN